MGNLSEQCHILTWCDVMAVSVPFWAYGMADDNTTSTWLAAAILTVGLIGLCIGINRHIMEKPVRHPQLCRYISLTARYVWPPIFGVLICMHFHFSALPFYLLTTIAVGAVFLADRIDL